MMKPAVGFLPSGRVRQGSGTHLSAEADSVRVRSVSKADSAVEWSAVELALLLSEESSQRGHSTVIELPEVN